VPNERIGDFELTESTTDINGVYPDQRQRFAIAFSSTRVESMPSPFSELDYWDYYEPRYQWGSHRSPLRFLERLHGEIEASGESFAAAGFSDDAIHDLVASGYIVVSGLVIDRNYVGLFSSSDLRSRIPIVNFCDESLYKQKSRACSSREVARRFDGMHR
jgi:hypothetical protein